MLLTKFESAPKTTTKWWMTTKKKLSMTKQSLLLYSKLNLKRKTYKFEESKLIATEIQSWKILVPSNQNNILFVLSSAKTRKYHILMTSQRTNTNLNLKKIELNKENVTKCNSVNGRVLIGLENLCKSLCIKFRKHLKVFNAENVFNYGEIIGGRTLI